MKATSYGALPRIKIISITILFRALRKAPLMWLIVCYTARFEAKPNAFLICKNGPKKARFYEAIQFKKLILINFIDSNLSKRSLSYF